MLERFYCPEPLIDGQAILTGDEARHLIRVRRVEVGEEVELFDGRGTAYRARVTTIGRALAGLTIQEASGPEPIANESLTLATAVPKSDRFDWLVEKATELGVNRLIPLTTERSVVDPGLSKLDRLRRSIIEASKQCRRNRLMELGNAVTWNSLVDREREATRFLAHPGGRSMVSAGLRARSGSVIVAIGPEGGFSDREVAQGVAAGWQAVGLGSTILRVETAAIAAVSILRALVADAESNSEAEES